MEWTREKTLSLISEYKKRRGLWDMTHEDYRKKEMKQKLLMEVSASLGGGIPIVEIEKKFHTLRTQYHREINRMKRKEPYNSKWFGFKNLQFLSSPKAMRASKGKIKAEITEDGVTKYIIRDATSRDSEPSPTAVAAATSTITTEFLTIHRSKPPTIAYETTPTSVPTAVPVPRVQKFESTRARDLEKLIEETTKDVEEPEDSKAKMIKEINLPLQHHSYSNNPLVTQEDTDHQTQQHQQQQHHQQHQEQHIEEEHLGTIDIQTSVEEENISYHHHNAPRLFKIQRRDTCNEEDYYEEEQQQQQHIQTKRMYYESPNAGAPAIASSSPSGMSATKLQQPTQPVRFRDDFATYGEYVANEMRAISNREILISLKHKINTALFEASMAELQQK